MMDIVKVIYLSFKQILSFFYVSLKYKCQIIYLIILLIYYKFYKKMF